MARLLSLKENAGPLAADLTAAADRLSGAPYGATSAAFKEIRDILMAGVSTNMDGSFVPLSRVTLDYKARKGFDSRPLHASGNTRAGLDGKHGATWAKAQRGSAEWYIFLHDRGRGYSHWSVEGRGKASGSRRDRRNAARPGATKFPERQIFFINSATESAAITRYTDLLQEIADGVKG